ncbi:MAG: FHA domain-containing protein [Rhodanobacteraceae bacterium]|nr:FHA domain-containing protein [Rhodanobacteraceae bacterium]
MALDLNAVDLSAVDALAAIKSEHDQVGERLKAMAARREQVSPEVYQRVHDDYKRRLDELASQAAPLKQRAGEAYRLLRAELANLEQAFSAARLDREEIEFRHALGEFDDAEKGRRVKAIDSRIDQHGKARDQAQSLKERFLAVVASEAELEGSDDDTARMSAISAPAASEATIIAAPIRPTPPADLATAVLTPAAPAPTAAPAPPAPASPAPPMAPAAAMPSPGARPVSRSSRNPDATVVFRQGRLEPKNVEAGSVVQTLGLKPVSIGSDAGCDLQLSANGVAKRHLEITMTRAGFCVRDIAASGSVRINGSVIQEHVLAEGDTLSVGPAQFNFRLL